MQSLMVACQDEADLLRGRQEVQPVTLREQGREELRLSG